MPLQLIVGRRAAARWECLDGMMLEPAVHPVRLIVPASQVLTCQQRLARAGQGGYLAVEVLTFGQLAYRLADEMMMPLLPTLDQQGQAMLMRRALALSADRLGPYAPMVGADGFSDVMVGALAQLAADGLSDGRLAGLVGIDDPLLTEKIEALTAVEARFRSLLADRFILPSDLMTRLPELVAGCPSCRGATYGIAGFDVLSNQQLMAIKAMLNADGTVTVALTGDRPFSGPAVPGELFYASHRTASALAGLNAGGPGRPLDIVMADEPDADTGMGRLARSLCQQADAGLADGTVRLVSMSNPHDEAAFAIAMVKDLVAGQGLHYRDIVVGMTDAAGYAPLLTQLADQEGMPNYSSTGRALAATPLGSFLLHLIEMGADDMPGPAVIGFLRSGLTIFDDDQVDRLENIILATGVAGAEQWRRPWTSVGAVMADGPDETEAPDVAAPLVDDGLRVRFVARYMPFITGLSQATDVRGFNDVIRGILKDPQVVIGLRRLAGQPDGGGLQAAWNGLLGLLDGLELDGDEKIDVQGYGRLLGNRLAGRAVARQGHDADALGFCGLGCIPQDIRVLIVLGANEGLLPAAISTKGIFTDADHDRLRQAGLVCGDDGHEQAYMTRQSLYELLTTPSDRLVVCCSGLGADGKALSRSYVIDDLAAAAGVDITPGVISPLALGQGTAFMAAGLSRSEDVTDEGLWTQLCRWYRDNRPAVLAHLLDGAAFANHADDITPATAIGLYGHDMVGSVTRLERFAECPFAFFAQYGLALKLRDEYGIQATDFGSIVHAVFETFGRQLDQAAIPWAQASRQQCHAAVASALAKAEKDSNNRAFFADPRNSRQRLTAVLEPLAWALCRQLAAGEFKPAAYELGYDQMGIAPISLADGGTIDFKGSIDRLDTWTDAQGRIAVKIIDYKTGNVTFDRTLLANGIRMQLIVYLKAALAYQGRLHPQAESVPAAVFYFHAALPEQGLDEASQLEVLRPSGLISDDPSIIAGFDRELKEGMKSAVAPVSLKKDGQPSRTAAITSQHQFSDYMAQADRNIIDIAGRIRQGSTAIAPYRHGNRSACTFCDYRAVCGFDTRIYGYRYRDLTDQGGDQDEEVD